MCFFHCDSCHTAVIQSAAVLWHRKSWLCTYSDSHREQKITYTLITQSSHYTTCHFPCSTWHFHHVGFLWIWNIWRQLISVCSQLNVPFVAQWSEASHGHVKHSTVALYRKTSVPYSVKCVGEKQGPCCRSVIVFALILPPLMFMLSRFLSLCVVQTSIKDIYSSNVSVQTKYCNIGLLILCSGA